LSNKIANKFANLLKFTDIALYSLVNCSKRVLSVAYDTAMTNKKNAYINWQAKANKVTEVENDLEDFKLVKGVAIEMEVKAGQAEAKVARLKASLNIVEVNEVKASDGKVVKTTKGVKVALGAIALYTSFNSMNAVALLSLFVSIIKS
jgi:hypothetical protein